MGQLKSFIGEKMSSKKPGCLAALFGLVIKQQEQTQEQFPYKAKQIFLSNAEASFYHLLKKMTGETMVIFPHIVLSDLVSFSGVDRTEYYRFSNRIDRKQVDFVLADSKTLRPILVIELDDSTHQRSDRVERDRFVEKVLETAQIPLARVPVRPSYDAKELGELFKTTIQTNQARITKAKEGDS
jgi:hypothetical protein